MLKKFSLENYRCFQKADFSFRELTVIVGKNNAGKSTLIEALRILSIVVNRCKQIVYTKAPSWLALSDSALGISPAINNLDISTRNIFYMYGEAPAIITATFESGAKIIVYVGEEAEIFSTIFSPEGLNVESKRFASSLKLDEINILPQISPLLRQEPIIKYETVIRNVLTNLSSRNFRNQLNYYSKEFEKFKKMAESTWQGLYIHSSSEQVRTQGELFLFVRDNNFEAEIGWMGHGLQMWLQTIWFLSRCSDNSTVILDEPDVYMHADLQRRLIKLVKDNFKQVMVATHSIEIMSEVEPENILPIDNSKMRQQYANKMPIVQKIVDDIGSVHNIEIARLFSSNKFLIVEGEKDDVKLLAIFQSKLFPNSFEQLDIIPKTFVEGWGGWQRVIGSNKVFKDNKATITTYCIFDSDYHTDKEKQERLLDAKANGINLHVWYKKEIENYLLIPNAIIRALKKRKKTISVNEGQIVDVIDKICLELKQDTIDCFASEIKQRDTIKDVKTVNQEARNYVNSRWDHEKWNLVSGKQVLSALFKWSSETLKVSLSIFAIAREINKHEICSELIEVLTCIENKTDFNEVIVLQSQ